ncbi:MAG TPA: oxygen-independent coproporphyrinogen III oxidase [Sphingomicrobium sp.]|nr:oxygen-independent coproporphyrinogen III oxidase [Sphingomicrobium sp.]
MIPRETFARYAAMHVPRYTSYPTAPNFVPSVGDGEYRQWLQSVDEEESLSIYLHIPFCREMCWYCGCHTSVSRRQEPISRYVSALIKEIRLVATRLRSHFDVRHVHWGGGSPTLLTVENIDLIHGALKANFSLDPLAENAVEIDPRTLTGELAGAFARAGVNRASLGVQSFDASVQAAINRMQSFDTTADAVRLLRESGIPAINFDLIYGLPFQSVGSCLETVEQAVRLQPDRLAVFGYAHVPSFKPHQRKIDQGALPGPAERFEQARAIADALTAAGYRQIGIDHFALPGDSLALAAEGGTLHRNFQGYTTDRCNTLLGFGASAIGRLAGGYVQNAPRIPDYERSIAAGRLATVRTCQIDEEDRRRGAIIEALMCNFRAPVGDIERDLSRFESDGLIRRSDGFIEVVEEARPLVRTIAAAFDSYLPHSAATHAVAI